MNLILNLLFLFQRFLLFSPCLISEFVKTNSSLSVKESSKDGEHIAAQIFVFRDLAAATRNFRAECLLGEGGFGRVYKGHLESINQVSHCYLIISLNRRKFKHLGKFHMCIVRIDLLICV